MGTPVHSPEVKGIAMQVPRKPGSEHAVMESPAAMEANKRPRVMVEKNPDLKPESPYMIEESCQRFSKLERVLRGSISGARYCTKDL
jgi:hypothetical protein